LLFLLTNYLIDSRSSDKHQFRKLRCKDVVVAWRESRAHFIRAICYLTTPFQLRVLSSISLNGAIACNELDRM